MSTPSLTNGICQKLNSGDKDDQSLWSSKPTLQFLSIKKVAAQNSPDRYRIIVSDGQHFLQAMLATQLNHLVEEERVAKNTIVLIENMSCQHILDKRLVIILALRVLQRESSKIGDPAPVTGPPPQTKPEAVSTSATSTSVPSSFAPPVHNPQAVHRANPIYPIVALTPYQNNWRIKARVVQKSDIRHYSNQRGDGRLFSVTFMDDSGEIKGTAWNLMVDNLYEKLQENRVYFVSKARVNLAKKKFSTLTNDYELSLDSGIEIEECHDTDVPVIRYNFVGLSALPDLQNEAICDVIVVLHEVRDVAEITTRNNKTAQKRDLVVVDDSKSSVRLTLWGKQAEQFSAPIGSIIAFKGVRVGEFNGRTLSLLSSGSMTVSPDIPEAYKLKGWYDDGGAQVSFDSHTQAGLSSGASGTINRSEMRTINNVREKQLGMSDKPDLFAMRATIMHIKNDNIMYPACPTPQCNKKVTEGTGGWRCEKCDRSYEKPEYRYIVSMAVGDYTGQLWLSGFNDVGIMLFGLTANELHSIRQEDESKANHIIQNATCNMYNFTCKASLNTFNEQNRVRYGIQKMLPLDYLAECGALVEVLRSSWAQ